MRRVAVWLVVLIIVLAGGACGWARWYPLPLPESPYAFSVKAGSSLRSVARELATAGIIPSEWALVGAARLARADRAIKAGNYELATGTTLNQLLAKLTQGDATQIAFTIVEGWNVADLRSALRAKPDIKATLGDIDNAQMMTRIGAAEREAEGWFFPDTYFFSSGSTDVSLLARANRLMRTRLDAAWAARAPGLPLIAHGTSWVVHGWSQIVTRSRTCGTSL